MVKKNLYPLVVAVGLSLIVPLTGNARPILTRKEYLKSQLLSLGEPKPGDNALTLTAGNRHVKLSPPTIGIFGGDNVELSVFGNFGNNILHSFTGRNLKYQLAAVLVTPPIVSSDLDYKVEHFFNTHPSYGRFALPVPYTGELLPFIAGGSLLAYAGIAHNDEVLGASFAVIQASIIELMDNIALKTITGRPAPNWRRHSNMDALSEEFRFGFLRGGIFNGWPSGHTGATMAVVSALMGYYPNSTWLKVAGYGLVAYTMYGVSSVDRGSMHWFSDAVAGALMAYAIGSTVGRYYRSVYSSITGSRYNPSSTGFSLGVTPYGFGLRYRF
jgi:hypothetical protein